jgi:UDP-N-acetylmuramate--alanine ligase
LDLINIINKRNIYMEINLNDIKKVYVIGIKGSGIVAIVEILHSRGKEIIGSDTNEKFFTDEILKNMSITYFEKFDKKNIPSDVDLVIYSTAYNESNNEEFKHAQNLGLPMISYPEMLAYLFNQKFGIAVCGTHGKTTTSAMLANTLKEVGVDPSAIIGSRVKNWNGNALSGNGEYFVAETDEYQSKLSLYDPKAVIFTSCDWDHPDYFESFESYKNTFVKFVEKIPKGGFLVVWGDSVDTLEIAGKSIAKVLTYGFGEDNNVRIENYRLEESENGNKFQKFEISIGEEALGEFETKLVGKHNVLNAAAVVATCHRLNLDMEKVREALKNFEGTSRRFEYIGQYNGAILIDDYGHHPDEIAPTLKGAREIYSDKIIWAVFHPHTYTRTKALLSEFAQSFADADKVIVLDIYGSAREIQGGVHSQELVDLINKFDRGKAEYVPTVGEVVKFLKDKKIDKNDVIITIGAGNVWEVAEKLKDK